MAAAGGQYYLAEDAAVPAWGSIKYGALKSFDALRRKLLRGPPWEARVEPEIMQGVVFPELSSPLPFMRGVAASCISEYVDVWLDPQMRQNRLRGAGVLAGYDDAEESSSDEEDEGTLNPDGSIAFPQSSPSAAVAVEGLYNLLRVEDESLVIVRVQAGAALSHLLRLGVGRDIIQTVLGECFQAFLGLLQQWDNDEIVTVIDTLIRTYKHQIAPYAIEIVQSLVGAFNRMAAEALEDDGDDGGLMNDEMDRGSTSGIALYEILNSIIAVLEASARATRGKPEQQQLFQGFCQLLVPLLQVLYGRDEFISFLDPTLKMHTLLTWISDAPYDISMWSLLGSLRGLFDSVGTDMMEAMLIPIDHYITKDTMTFFSPSDVFAEQGLTNPLELCLEISEKLLAVYAQTLRSYVSDHDAADGCRLLEALLYYGRGHAVLAESLPRILNMVLVRMQAALAPGSSTKTFLKILLVEVILVCIWAFPTVSVQILAENQALASFLQLWLQAIPGMTRAHDKKICVSALLAVLGFDFDDPQRCILSESLVSERAQFHGVPEGQGPLRSHSRAVPLAFADWPDFQPGKANFVATLINVQYELEMQRQSKVLHTDAAQDPQFGELEANIKSAAAAASASHGRRSSDFPKAEADLLDEDGELDDEKELQHENEFHARVAELAAMAAAADGRFPGEEDGDSSDDYEEGEEEDETIADWDDEDEPTDAPLYDVDELGCVVSWLQTDAPQFFGDEAFLATFPLEVQNRAGELAQLFAERQQLAAGGL